MKHDIRVVAGTLDRSKYFSTTGSIAATAPTPALAQGKVNAAA